MRAEAVTQQMLSASKSCHSVSTQIPHIESKHFHPETDAEYSALPCSGVSAAPQSPS